MIQNNRIKFLAGIVFVLMTASTLLLWFGILRDPAPRMDKNMNIVCPTITGEFSNLSLVDFFTSPEVGYTRIITLSTAATYTIILLMSLVITVTKQKSHFVSFEIIAALSIFTAIVQMVVVSLESICVVRSKRRVTETLILTSTSILFSVFSVIVAQLCASKCLGNNSKYEENSKALTRPDNMLRVNATIVEQPSIDDDRGLA
ncbi:hypothetical protein ACOME3_007573 [Neoechinorhynchus agilis]